MSDSSRQPRPRAAAGAVVAVGGDPVDLLVAGVEAVGGVAGEGGRGRRPDERRRQAGEDLADVGPGGAVGRRRADPGAVGRVVHAVGVAQEDGLAQLAHAFGQLAQVDVVAALGDLGRAGPVADGDQRDAPHAPRPRPGASPAGTRTARRCGRWPGGGRCAVPGRARPAAGPPCRRTRTAAPRRPARPPCGVRASSPWAPDGGKARADTARAPTRAASRSQGGEDTGAAAATGGRAAVAGGVAQCSSSLVTAHHGRESERRYHGPWGEGPLTTGDVVLRGI